MIGKDWQGRNNDCSILDLSVFVGYCLHARAFYSFNIFNFLRNDDDVTLIQSNVMILEFDQLLSLELLKSHL